MSLVFEPLRPRIYICSFPKSGTHLAIRIAAHLAVQQKPKHWLGSFSDNSWSTDWIDFESYIKPVIYGQPAGTWMMGHMGFKQKYLDAFNEMKTCVLFVYRDLRDVTVSQTYHIENPDDERFKHSGKSKFMALEDHQARLQAVIKGLDDYPGIFERWQLYKGWLDQDQRDVLSVRFEDMVNNPRQVAQNALNYITLRTAGNQMPVVFQDNFADAIEHSINLMVEKEGVSYRAGRVGDWHFEMSDETKAIFEKEAKKYGE